MKKLITLLLSLALVVTSLAFYQPRVTKADYSLKYTRLEYKPSFNKVKLKWPKKKNVSYYVISKAKVNKKTVNKSGYITRKKYKQIATVNGKKKSYTDRNVKMNKRYAYIIEGYKKKGGKKYQTYTSYTDIYNDVYTGLDKPLLTHYYSDNYDNTANRVYMHSFYGSGMVPKKFIIYRKASNESKYKKLNLKPAPNSDDDPYLYCDGSVKPNITYKYKTKSYYKKKGKKYYSKYSSVYKVTPCNSTAKFKVDCLTAEGTGVNEFIIKITGDIANGKTVFYDNKSADFDEYSFRNTENYSYSYKAIITEYSTDGKTWKSIANTSVSTKANQILYLKIKLEIKPDDSYDKIIFGGKQKESSILTLESISYYGPNHGSSSLNFNFTEGSGVIWEYND